MLRFIALFLGFFIYDFGWFNTMMPFVYGSFAASVCLGLIIRHRRTPLLIGGAALAGSVLFFVVSNLGVWLHGSLYPMTLEGLVTCYLAAIPFFRYTIAGDAVYTMTLFGGFALAERYFTVLREEPRLVSVRIS